MKPFFFFLLIAGAVAFSAGGFDAVESVAREQEAATTDSTDANTPIAPTEPNQEEPGSNTEQTAEDAPEKNKTGIWGKIWAFIQFTVYTGLIFAALWFGLPLVISRWRELKAETTSVSTTPPKVVQPSAPQSAFAQEEESLSPEWPKLQGARPRAHYLANNFTTQQLHIFLADLEASRENRPDSPYAPWGNEEIDRFTSDVRNELADRTR